MTEYSTIDPAPPGLEGVTWRPIGRDELAAVVELADACHLADGGLAFLNEPENLQGRYFPDAPGAAIGAFAADDRLVACATVHLDAGSDAQRAVAVGQVRPDLRNRGIGTFLMRWSQVQARALFTAASGDERLLQIVTEGLTEPARRLYQAHGFEPVDEQLVGDEAIPDSVRVGDCAAAPTPLGLHRKRRSLLARTGGPGCALAPAIRPAPAPGNSGWPGRPRCAAAAAGVPRP